MWLARDKDGTLCMYDKKPSKDRDEGWWYSPLNNANFVGIDNTLFPQVKWSDKEPTEVEITIKLK